VAEETWETLMRFHREVFLPDMERLFADLITPLCDELRRNRAHHLERLERLSAEHGGGSHDPALRAG
jgi:hypothetical protein